MSKCLTNHLFAAALALATGGSLLAQTPLAGVKITTSDGKVVYTDSQGYYTLTVPSGWNGNLTLAGNGLTFAPNPLSFNNITISTTANFTGTDTQPPSGTITNPPNGSTVRKSLVVNCTISVSDNVKVASVQWMLDGSPLGPAITTAPFSYTLDVATPSYGFYGWHTLSATVRDSSGNSTSATSTFFVRWW